MGAVSSWKLNSQVVTPLVGLAVLAGGVGLVLCGASLWESLRRTVSLPLWEILLLSLGPALVTGSLLVYLRFGKRPAEMERRPLIVKGVRWRWWTELNGSLRVVPYCEACDLQLRPREIPGPMEAPPGFVLHCNSCSHETDPFHGPLDHAPQLTLDYFMQNLRKEIELSHSGS